MLAICVWIDENYIAVFLDRERMTLGLCSRANPPPCSAARRTSSPENDALPCPARSPASGRTTPPISAEVRHRPVLGCQMAKHTWVERVTNLSPLWIRISSSGLHFSPSFSELRNKVPRNPGLLRVFVYSAKVRNRGVIQPWKEPDVSR